MFQTFHALVVDAAIGIGICCYSKELVYITRIQLTLYPCWLTHSYPLVPTPPSPVHLATLLCDLYASLFRLTLKSKALRLVNFRVSSVSESSMETVVHTCGSSPRIVIPETWPTHVTPASVEPYFGEKS